MLGAARLRNGMRSPSPVLLGLALHPRAPFASPRVALQVAYQQQKQVIRLLGETSAHPCIGSGFTAKGQYSTPAIGL
jgi:hypothetical protein